MKRSIDLGMGNFCSRYGCVLTVMILLQGVCSMAQTFTDQAAEQGLNFTVPTDAVLIDFGSGVSFCDFDADGWDDLSFTSTNDSLRFFRNNGGQLEALPSFADGPGYVKSVLWVDYDNDGVLDLFISTNTNSIRLLRNTGELQFTDVTEAAGLPLNAAQHTGASWGDYDRDGFLDLYVCQYEWDMTPPIYPRLNHLYHNEGNGTFTDVTEEAGVGNGIQYTFQSIWYDQDKDGWPDLMLINDRASSNSHYHNNGDGTFTDIADQSGFALPGEDCMTLSPGDFDNDGDLDMYFTNTGITSGSPKPSKFLVDNGDGTYTESGALYGLDDLEMGWGAVWGDVDNDGFKDLYYTTHDWGASLIPSILRINEQGAGFSDGADLFLDPHEAASFCTAIGDLNNDGNVDILVQNGDPYEPFLWVNGGNGNNSLRISLKGTLSNYYGIGSWVEVFAGDLHQTHYTFCGENLLSQSSQHLHFGLGTHTMADSVRITFPSGHIDVFHQLEAGMDHLLVEGSSYMPSISASGSLEFCGSDSLVLDAGEHDAYLWSTGDTTRFITVLASGTFSVTTTNEFGVQGTSGLVNVLVQPPPVVDFSSENPHCHEDATGSIELVVLGGSGISDVAWSNGMSGATIEGLVEGDYTYLLTDSAGCSVSGTVSIAAPPELVGVVSTSPANNGNNGSLELLLFGGTPPYAMTIDGTPFTTTVEGLAVGTYQIVVVDSNGCIWEDAVVIDGVTGMAVPNQDEFMLIPNPATDLIRVQGLSGNEQLAFFGMDGKEVGRYSGPFSGPIDVSALGEGSYLVRVIGGQGTLYIRFVKVR